MSTGKLIGGFIVYYLRRGVAILAISLSSVEGGFTMKKSLVSCRRLWSFLLILTMVFSCMPVFETAKADTGTQEKFEKKIVGYFLGEDRPSDAISTVGLSLKDNIEKINYASLTHLNVSFMGPADKTSDVPNWIISDMSDSDVRRIIELCHQNNVKCILSVGGGANNGYKFFASEARSNSFYNQILTFLDVYGFDGIDMDIESTTDKDKYSAMLSKLSGDLKQRNKTLSMAVAPYIIEGLGTNVSYFDYFNVMTYDQNGSGTMNVADYDWTMSQLNSYAYQSIPKEKMIVGLPFYGYSTDGRAAWNCDYDYAKVVKMCKQAGNTDYLTKDSVSIPGQYNIYRPGQDFKVEINSRTTIMKKADFVKNSDYGGVMIWDVTKDCIRDEDKDEALLPAVASYFSFPSQYEGPFGLIANDLTEESVHLEWNAPTSWDAVTYKVYYDNNLLGKVETNNTCCVISQLTSGFKYNFKVVAIDPDGNETRPATLTITTPGTSPMPDVPEYVASQFYPSGSVVSYNGQVWKARWGGSGETPTGVSGNMWVLDTSVVITPSKTPVLSECEEHGTPTAPTITTDTLTSGKVGSNYNKAISVKGTKPITFSIASGLLPNGLSLDAKTGTISGIAQVAGTFTFTVKATNSEGFATKDFSIAINEKPQVDDDYDKEPGTSKRVIGYLPWWRNTDINNLDYAKLDYVIVAFLRYTKDGWDFGKMADGTGGWTTDEIRNMVNKAHSNGCKVFISVGGGDGGFIQSSLPFWYETSREYLVNCIFNAVDEFGFDGVDMDAETDDVKFWQGYNEFVDLLRDGIDARGLEMSMAVHTWFTDLIEDEAALYKKYDFLNVMNYDCQYNRNGERIGIGEVDHAPMWHAYQLLDHYTDLGVPADKLNVGIPFYYYTKGGGWDGAVSYAYYLQNQSSDVTIDTNPGESKVDAWKRTTEQKAYLGGTEYGGAFIWELGQDNLNNKPESLLNLVYDCVKNEKAPNTPLSDSDKEYPELANVSGTDLPLTAVDKASAKPDYPFNTGIELESYFQTLKIGETTKIAVKTGSNVSFSIRNVEGNDGIISVDSSGNVTAISAGAALVDVVSGSSKATFTVRVLNDNTSPNGSVISDDIAINGYNINTKIGGHRVVYSFNDTVEGKAITEVGIIYGLKYEGYKDEDMFVGSNNDNVRSFAGTEERGRYPTALDGYSRTYVMSMYFAVGTKEEFTSPYAIRAYAKLSDGTYAYSQIYTYTIYNLAEKLYTQKMCTSKAAHDYLYDNILKVVEPSYIKINY